MHAGLPTVLVKEGSSPLVQQLQRCHHQQVVVHPNRLHNLKKGPKSVSCQWINGQ